MEKLYAKPYKLYNKIQNYEWGTKNGNAFIPNLLGIPAEPDLPYAELWVGAHPKAPSEIKIDGTLYPLDKIIEQFPTEMLGQYAAEKYDNKLPFLLKVLSAAKALSIQTHPNKEQAVKLHAADPVNYPDDNHKPEIAIALDSLTAIAGFRPVDEIVVNLKKYPELQEFASKEFIDKIFEAKDKLELSIKLNMLYSMVMNSSSDKEKLSSVIDGIIKKLTGKDDLTLEEKQFIKQHELYGTDVGLLSFFFFNIVQLKPGQAIFTGAGTPHAYIEGNIIECMANSDNVVRAGLTNKFKDVNTLLEILDYSFAEYDVLNKEQKEDGVNYITKAEEFEVTAYTKEPGYSRDFSNINKPLVILLTEGSLKVKWMEDGKECTESFSKGESFIIPAMLHEYTLSCDKTTKYFLVKIPYIRRAK
ncbi:MAG: mannose-6-phosphate isomerase, class I [Ignavibacteriaceae bacterium]|nr:mannose-6-phosphate isomerase, class I [Ignavibacteriaceae bacterium]